MLSRAHPATALLLLLLAWAAAPAAAAPAEGALGDDGFLDRLDEMAASEAATPEMVDRVRLGKLLFGQSAALVGGRSGVRLLQNALVLRESDARAVRAVVADAYEAYDRAVDRFRVAVSQLLDRSDSSLRLYRALVAGQEACWLQDRYVRMTETYGAESADLVRVLPATEACVTLRRVSFNPLVSRLVERDLQRTADLADEVEALTIELTELESLLDDLEEIEKRP